MGYLEDCKCPDFTCYKQRVCRPPICPGKLNCLQILQGEATLQKKIWNQLRVQQSQYIQNLSSLSVTGNRTCGKMSNLPKKKYSYVNWNQSSDRAIPSISYNYVPRRATANRPGATSSAGVGVDIKHNSYARYLARKNSANLQTSTNLNDDPSRDKFGKKLPPHLQNIPLYGNKWFTTGIINNCNKLACCNDKLYCTERDCKNPQIPKQNFRDCFKPVPCPKPVHCYKPKCCDIWD